MPKPTVKENAMLSNKPQDAQLLKEVTRIRILLEHAVGVTAERAKEIIEKRDRSQSVQEQVGVITAAMGCGPD